MSDVLEATTPSPDHTLTYADRPDAVVDLHLPPEGDGPLLYLIHGGFWKAAYDRLHTRPLAAALAARGWVVATPEYRRVGDGESGGGGGWPMSYDDVRTAYDTVLAHTGAHGSVVTGHSAGGHLALLLSADDERVLASVPLAPVCDLGAAVDLNLGDGAAARFLDGAPTEDADPVRRRYRVPVTIVHGIADDIVPIQLARAFALWHTDTRLVEIDCGHFEPIDPDQPAFAAYAAQLDGYSSLGT